MLRQNTKRYKKIFEGDSMGNGIEESKLSKTRHIQVEATPGGKIKDMQQNLKDLLHEDLETVIIHAGTSNATTDTPQMIVDKLITLKRNIEGSLPKMSRYHKQFNRKNRQHKSKYH